MIVPLPFKDQKIAVLGLGKSGRSVVKSLEKAGAQVFAWDDQLTARDSAIKEGIHLTDLSTIAWEKVDHLILSPGIPHHYPAPNPIVAQAQIAGHRPLSDIEVLYRSQPVAKYIGVTGTNGKSTTTTLIAHILKENQKIIEVGGNLGIPVMELNPLEENETYVLEVSSYQLEISPTLHFDVGVLLNITPDHLERHGGMEGYIAAKKLIYRKMKSGNTLVISVDDEPCMTIYETLKASNAFNLVPVSVCKTLTDGMYVKDGMLFEKLEPIYNLKNLISLKGQHNWQNIAAAYAALRAIGLEPDAIMKGVITFPGLAHRQEEVARFKDVTFINDSKATNAEATAKALACFNDSALYCLLGGRPKEGGIQSLKSYFPQIKHAILFGEAADSFAVILEGNVPYSTCETLKEATQKASEMAFQDNSENKVVLLSPACASFDQFRDFEERGEVFKDIVKECIDKR